MHGALFAYDRYSDKYVPIASVDGIGDAQNLILDRGAKLVNEYRLLGESVHLACEHKSVPTSNVGTLLMELVGQSPGFKELCLIPLTAGTNRVGALLFAMSDCNPSMLERVRDIESAGPIASAFLQLHQTSRQWDRQQHISSVLQFAVENLCDAPSSAQKLLFDHQKSAPHPDQHLRLPERHHVDEDPEEAILPILKSIYGAFGLDVRFVPFYDENSGFSIG